MKYQHLPCLFFSFSFLAINPLCAPCVLPLASSSLITWSDGPKSYSSSAFAIEYISTLFGSDCFGAALAISF